MTALSNVDSFLTAPYRPVKVILSISLDTFSTKKSKQVCNQLSEMEQISTERSEMDICFILGIA